MYIFLSYFIDTNTPVYGGGKSIKIDDDRSIKNGDTANTKNLNFNNHTGTHIDFPNHFFENGATSEKYGPEFWICNNVCLINRPAVEDEIILLDDDFIDSIPSNVEFIIIKTGFGKYREEEKYWKNNPGLSPSNAERLRREFKNLKMIGMDFISLTAFQHREIGRAAHREFLGGDSPILLVEDMKLDNLSNSPLSVYCSPLLISGVDGAPITIIAKI
jgi:kynurenine formamidase